MPDVTLQSVSQDVDESDKCQKEENIEDHKDENRENHKEDGTNKPEALQGVFCNICLVRLTSKAQALTHFDGSRHKKAVALLIEHTKSLASEVADQESNADVILQDSKAEVTPQDSNAEVTLQDSNAEVTPQDSNAEMTPLTEDQNDETKKPKRIGFFCDICVIKMTSTSQIDFHYEGKKHKRALEILKEHPRSLDLDQLAEDQEFILQKLEDVEHLNNICVVKPTSRSSDDPLGEESNQGEALAGNTTPSKKTRRKKRNSSNVTTESTEKDSDEGGEKQKEDTPSENKPKKSKKSKAEEIFCDVCLVKLTSQAQADNHNQGTKHKRALAIASGELKPVTPAVKKKNKNISIVALPNYRQYANRNTFDLQYANRNTNTYRMRPLGLQSYLGPPGYLGSPSFSRVKPTKNTDKECICSICVVKLTSTYQAIMHYEGRHHKRAAAVAAGISEQKLSEGNQKKNDIVCEVCHVTLSSQVVADAHFGGLKHKKKLELFQSRHGGPAAEGQAYTESVCDICLASLPSKVVADAHYAGAKHKRKLQIRQSISANASETPSNEKQAQVPVAINRSSSQVMESSPMSITPTAGGIPEEHEEQPENNFFSCDVCNIKVNSQQQMEAHYQGTRHQNQVVGPATRITTQNRPPARGRMFGGGMLTGNPWAGPTPTFTPRPRVQYNPQVL